jgi:hypothetical protein
MEAGDLMLAAGDLMLAAAARRARWPAHDDARWPAAAAAVTAASAPPSA